MHNKYLPNGMILILAVMGLMFIYFIFGHMQMNDDGFQYEGFAESLASGKLDFKSFYGFQGLSFFAVPIFWLSHSHNSIIIASMIFTILSVPLSYFIGRDIYKNRRAGIYSLILFLLMPYPYTTLMRGFQEAALLFFILLIAYGSINKKSWPPLAWGVGGIVKPFSLTLFPLFLKDFLLKKRIIWLVMAIIIGLLYLGANYYQTGHFINNAAINSYQGNFNLNDVPSLLKSFTLGFKGFLRVGANLLLAYRKIMISPFIILIGTWFLFKNKQFSLRWKFIFSILLNILLVGILTFSFSKYLLPAVVLFALASIGFILEHRWVMIIVFIDSLTVFLPIWNYFGHVFWSNIYVYLLPFWFAILIYIVYEFIFRKYYPVTHSE